MDKTDEILERLKEWEPAIDSPDELTERIMAQLPERETESHHWRVIAFRAQQYVSTIAAVLLVGLFLYQHTPNGNVNEVPHYYTSNLSAGSTLKNVYTSRQHQEKILSYTQFKTMLYENK